MENNRNNNNHTSNVNQNANNTNNASNISPNRGNNNKASNKKGETNKKRDNMTDNVR